MTVALRTANKSAHALVQKFQAKFGNLLIPQQPSAILLKNNQNKRIQHFSGSKVIEGCVEMFREFGHAFDKMIFCISDKTKRA